jgi:hypothetical protein
VPPRDARIADLFARLTAAGLAPVRKEYADRTLVRAQVPDSFPPHAWSEVLAVLETADSFGSTDRPGGVRHLWAAFRRTTNPPLEMTTVFHPIRIGAAWLARQLLPASGAHRQHPPSPVPFNRAACTPARRQLRRHAPTPRAWTDDGPLIRPYVLSAEEWTRRRHEGRPRAASRA